MAKPKRHKSDSSDDDEEDFYFAPVPAERHEGGRPSHELSDTADDDEYNMTEEEERDEDASSISLDLRGCAPNQLFCSWCDGEPRDEDSFSAAQQ